MELTRLLIRLVIHNFTGRISHNLCEKDLLMEGVTGEWNEKKMY